MTYKCLPGDTGVDVSLNQTSVFKFESRTHFITSLGGDRVRITRKIDNTHDIYDSPISNFVDLNGVPVATDYASLVAYFTKEAAVILAGEGISVDGKKVSVVAGGPSTLGGYKVGTGLMVDGTGKLSATASSEVTKVLSTQVEMLALAAEPLRPYRVIRLDTKKLYYLNAGTSPSVIGNWFTGPSIEAAVVSFKGRTGAVEPSVGDYDQDMVNAIDKSTSTTYKFVIDNAKLFIEDVETQERREIANQESLTGFDARFTTLTDIVTNQSDGLVKRVLALETATPPKDFTSSIEDLKSKDEQLNTLVLAVNDKVDSTAANTVVLDQRLQTIESRPQPKDFTAEINAIKTTDLNQDSKIISIEAQLLNKAGVVNGKIPYELLPEFPVGRKVNVANRAARLALSPYPDLTIAYESDTGDAWGLDSNDNPAISSNWSKLGNAQAIGVSSFNGRSGSIGPQTGDYNTGQITELTTKRFVTETQIAKWEESANTVGVKSFKTRTGDIVPANGDYTADLISETSSRKFVNPSQVTSWDGKETTTGSQAKATAAQTAAKTYADSTFIPLTQKNAANGLAPLGSDKRVPMVNLPLHLPQKPRVWVNVFATRAHASWITNTSGNEMVVFIRSTSNTAVTRHILIQVRKDSGSTSFEFRSDAQDAALQRWIQIQTNVPAGWQYNAQIIGGTPIDKTGFGNWYELS